MPHWTPQEYAKHNHSEDVPCTKLCPVFTGKPAPLSLCQRKGCTHYTGEHENGTGPCNGVGRGPDGFMIAGTSCECLAFAATVPAEQGLLPLDGGNFEFKVPGEKVLWAEPPGFSFNDLFEWKTTTTVAPYASYIDQESKLDPALSYKDITDLELPPAPPESYHSPDHCSLCKALTGGKWKHLHD